MPADDAISTVFYAVVSPGESRQNSINSNLGVILGNWGKLKIDDQRSVDTLMTYHHAKNLPILSRDKESVFFCFCGQTDTQTDRVEQWE